MFSYQHIYHAGNAADLHKHLWLITVLNYLTLKDKPLCWIDTHAGRGLYDLTSPEAQKTGEYKSALVPAYEALPNIAAAQPAAARYLSLIQKYNTDHNLSHYPGSALIAANLLRNCDRLIACDLHKGEFPHLQQALQPHSQAKAVKEDGLKILRKSIPPQERRGGALIDPSYEIKSEYETVGHALLEAYQKWATGIFMLWYPILPAGRHAVLKNLFANHPAALIDEWHWAGTNTPQTGMSGSGMIVLNAPYTCPETMTCIKDALLGTLNAS